LLAFQPPRPDGRAERLAFVAAAEFNRAFVLGGTDGDAAAAGAR
jgi:hypothetical protein